jgi:hypothetical protein
MEPRLRPASNEILTVTLRLRMPIPAKTQQFIWPKIALAFGAKVAMVRVA